MISTSKATKDFPKQREKVKIARGYDVSPALGSPIGRHVSYFPTHQNCVSITSETEQLY